MNWQKELAVGITVCDSQGKIIEINDRAQAALAKDAEPLLGKNLFDCHQPQSIELIKDMLATGKSHTYTVAKKGQKKLIHQLPWYEDGKVAGLVEFSILLPDDMPHYDRG